MMPAATIYLVEDHLLMRDLLHEFLVQMSEHTVAGTARSAEVALQELDEREVDVFLIDVALPDMNGLDLLEQIRARRPGALCIMLTGHREAGYARRAFASGASGYVLKGNPRELIDAIDRVLAGHRYLSEPLRAELG